MSEERTSVIEVAVPLPIKDVFSYHLPPETKDMPPRGARVLVPFKNRDILGYVIGQSDAAGLSYKTKPVREVLDTNLCVSEHMLALTRRLSEYYCCSWGEAISNAMPQLFKKLTAVRKRVSKQTEPVAEEGLKAKRAIIELNTDQTTTVRHIAELLDKARYAAVLLHGITASGKTEVYLRAIEHCLSLGKTAICLVPEIALTAQIRDYFQAHFGDEVVVMHSRMTPRERYDAWLRIHGGGAKIVLGPRSAVFAPLDKLGLIIIDEEQEDTYKQEETPRYRAHTVAGWRAEAEQALLILGSATPSLEAIYQVGRKKLVKLELKERATQQQLPDMEVVDLKGEKTPMCSRVLKRAIEQALSRKEGVLLFLNRRGFSTQLRCMSCQEIARCRYCYVALTFHQELGAAVCHYCNFRWTKLAQCPSCTKSDLRYLGLGVERVESEFARLFPGARIARLDTDVARKKGKTADVLTRFRKREIDILVGTQMIAKGHDFPQVTVVGVLLADLSLALPDFRSSERTFQILVQVAGRAGRGAEKGRVIIQTYSPDHYSIRAAVRHDYAGFYAEELASREKADYPPFCHFINVIVRGPKPAGVEEYIFALRELLKQKVKDELFTMIGPAPCPIPKLRGHYRWHLLLRTRSVLSSNQVLRESFEGLRKPTGVQVAVDVDPANIL